MTARVLSALAFADYPLGMIKPNVVLSGRSSRRNFLTGAGAVAVAPFFTGKVLGANDRVTVGIVGIRGQGRSHIGGFAKIPGVKIKTLCDIDENIYADRIKMVQDRAQYAPGTAFDMRRVFDDKDIDAVSFATPNFWHALGTIWACQAGKHVYVEKPASHGVWEGRQMVNAARKYKTLVQVGFQNRSRPNTRAGIEFLRSGKLGTIYKARGLCFKPRQNIGTYPDGPMAEGSKCPPMVGHPDAYTKSYLDKVHYDLWQGPTAARPFNPNRFHYNWHWQFEYGGGDTGNQGPHQFDVGRWGLNKHEYPIKVKSSGGLFGWSNTQQDTPNEQTSVLEYADGTIFEFATRGLPTNSEGGVKIGNIFYGSEGRMEIDAEGNWKTFMGPKDELGPDSKSIKLDEKADALNTIGTGMSGHFGSFIAAVKAGKQELLTCDIEEGHRSSSLALISNIAYRMKRELKFDGKKEQFVGDAEANKLLRRADRKGFQVPNLGGVGA